jgi:CSLREA domain-containing protein
MNKNTAFQKEELKMKIKVRFCLSVLAILALILLTAVAEAVPLPDALGIQPAIGSVGSENPLSSEYGNFPQANILVTTLADVSAVDGYCSLREAIQAANTDAEVNECPAGTWPGADTITFSVSGTITLSSQLEVTGTGPLLIDGSNGITISGGDSVRIFSLSDTALLTLVELSLVDGTAVEGGAIKNLSNLTLWDSTISGSQATGNSTGGGGIYNTGTLKVFNSTLSGNEASSNSGRGGAIYNHQGTVYLTNTTLSGNYAAEDGGGIYSTGTLYLANATLYNNNAGDHGGGVFTQNYALYIRNTIIAKNTASLYSPDCYVNTVSTSGYNLIGNTQGCGIYPVTGDLLGVDPKLGPLQDNGGPTFTLALLPGSLAINHGNPNHCIDYLGYWVDIDQRGFPRTDRCDIGAFEWQPLPAVGPYSLFLPCVVRSCSTRLFFDDFSNPASGWKILETAFGRYEYLDNEYRILAKVVPAWEASLPGFKATDYVVSVEVRNATGVNGYYGILFSFAEDWSHFYFFVVHTNGRYVILRADPDTSYWIADGYSSIIHTGTASNKLKLERNGSMIWAYANGELLTILKDGTFTGLGYVGLITVADTNPNVDARFDNFTVEPISCGASYNYPVLAGMLWVMLQWNRRLRQVGKLSPNSG